MKGDTVELLQVGLTKKVLKAVGLTNCDVQAFLGIEVNMKGDTVELLQLV